MSATDSDNSIDWLASDNEDYDSERESDCSGTHGRAEPPPSPDAPPTRLGLPRREVREGERDRSEVRDASSRGAAPSSCGGTLGRDDRCKTGGQTTGRHTLKRHCSLTDAEQKERPLVSEKDLLFTRKVSAASPNNHQHGEKLTGVVQDTEELNSHLLSFSVHGATRLHPPTVVHLERPSFREIPRT